MINGKTNFNTSKISLFNTISLFLLHVWLLALAAKDASVIITIKKLDDVISNSTDTRFKVSKRQCKDYAGIISNLQNCPMYAYTIGVIDIDRKPVDKVYYIANIILSILS